MMGTNPLLAPRQQPESCCSLRSPRDVSDAVLYANSVMLCCVLVCRATRGNMFLRQTPVGAVKDPATGEQQEKHVFVVFYAGERARTKVLKVRGW